MIGVNLFLQIAAGDFARRANHPGCPVSVQFLSSPSAKNISLRDLVETALSIRTSRLARGTYASSRTLRWDAVDAMVSHDERR
jgi:hypothetical protein